MKSAQTLIVAAQGALKNDGFRYQRYDNHWSKVVGPEFSALVYLRESGCYVDADGVEVA